MFIRYYDSILTILSKGLVFLKIFGVDILPAITDNTPGVPAHSAKSFMELAAGDSFRALVLDIVPGYVTIRLNNGESLTAKSLALPEARIGDETVFTVKDNAKGQIFLEMQKPGMDMILHKLAGEALKNAGVSVSNENMELAAALMEHKIPIDSEHLQKAMFFKYAGGLDMDKVLFLLKEHFPATIKSVDELNAFVNDTRRLNTNLSHLMDRLFVMPDSDEKDEILEKLAIILKEPRVSAEGHARRSAVILRRLAEHFYINPKKNELPEIRDLYTRLHRAAADILAKEPLSKTDPEVNRILTQIKDGIEFMDHIREYKYYMQLPLVIDGEKRAGELCVFKDRKTKKADRGASVLIGLDLPALSRVEAFIQLNNRVLKFQFRSDNAHTLKIIGRKFDELQDVLFAKGYSVLNAAYKKIDEPFTVVNDLETIKKIPETRRYAFDIRI